MKRLNKKGFTLIELLAVIVILAVLMLIAMPNVLNMMETSKVSAFKVEAEAVVKAAQQKWAADSITNTKKTCYDAAALADNYSFKTGYTVRVAINDAGTVTAVNFASDKYFIETTSPATIDKATYDKVEISADHVYSANTVAKQPTAARSYNCH